MLLGSSARNRLDYYNVDTGLGGAYLGVTGEVLLLIGSIM